MVDDIKKRTIVNSDAFSIFSDNPHRTPPEFLDSGIDYERRLFRLIKDKYKPEGHSLENQTPGRVIFLETDVSPYPGGWIDKINQVSETPQTKCNRIYVHTRFDKHLTVPQNLISPNQQDLKLIYEHYPYEYIPGSAADPLVGDFVFVIHPLAYGFTNPVGVYVKPTGQARSLAPMSVSDSGLADFLRNKQFPRYEPPLRPQEGQEDECLTGDGFGDECGWSNGRKLGKLKLVSLSGQSNLKLEPKAANAWKEMRAAAKSQGVTLTATSAFRTWKQQEKARQTAERKNRPQDAAIPGRSRHQAGRAVDINVNNSKDSEAYLWLARKAHLFGFARTVEHELWHWVYFGVPAAESERPSYT